MPDIHIGTSGWCYAHWRYRFYPKQLPAKDYLRMYAQNFTVTEINTTFYQVPSARTVYKWVRCVPPFFLFCPKMYRGITHDNKLRGTETMLSSFFTAIEPLKGHMGPVLIQLPPYLNFRRDVADNFFETLRDRYNIYDYAVEIRHSSWLQAEAIEMLKSYNIGFVIAMSGNRWPSADIITNSSIYLRLHGPNGTYSTC